MVPLYLSLCHISKWVWWLCELAQAGSGNIVYKEVPYDHQLGYREGFGMAGE